MHVSDASLTLLPLLSFSPFLTRTVSSFRCLSSQSGYKYLFCVTIWLHKGSTPLCVLVSMTAVNYVSLLAQAPYYCGLCKVEIEFSQLACGTKHRFRKSCLLSDKKFWHSASVQALTGWSAGTLNCPLSMFYPVVVSVGAWLSACKGACWHKNG